MLIDLSYFIGEINIPNTDQDSVMQSLNSFINKYETEFLQKLFGYAFYKAFLQGITVTPPASPAQRWTDLIYGAEYTSLSTGKLEKWKGLLIAEIPVYSFGTGFFYKTPYWIQADVTPGFVSGIDTATFTDWIGWTPVIDRLGGNGMMQEDVDYTFDSDTGLLTLLNGDTFQTNERFYVSFQLKPQNETDIDKSIKQSLIANYVYYWYMRNAESQSTGIGEAKTQPAGALTESAATKVVRAWNEMAQWIYELYDFLQASTEVYPEYDSNSLTYSMFYYFKKINSFF